MLQATAYFGCLRAPRLTRPQARYMLDDNAPQPSSTLPAKSYYMNLCQMNFQSFLPGTQQAENCMYTFGLDRHDAQLRTADSFIPMQSLALSFAAGLLPAPARRTAESLRSLLCRQDEVGLHSE